MSMNGLSDKINKNPSKDNNILNKSDSSEYKIFYDFYEDAWIGYLSSEESDPLYLASVADEKKYPSDLKANITHTLETFKNNGVNQIETDFQITNEILISVMESNNYEYMDSERLVSRLSVEDIKLSPKYENKEFLISQMKSFGLHSEPSFLRIKSKSELEENVINFLIDKENISKESLRSFFDYLKKNPDKIISQTIFMDDESIQGYTMVVRTRWNKATGILSFLDIKNPNNNLKDLIFAQSIHDCKNNDIDQLEVHIRDDVMEKENGYLAYGFEFNNVHRFQLND